MSRIKFIQKHVHLRVRIAQPGRPNCRLHGAVAQVQRAHGCTCRMPDPKKFGDVAQTRMLNKLLLPHLQLLLPSLVLDFGWVNSHRDCMRYL